MKAIGVDIGGTKMAVAAVDTHGAILARVTLPTEADQGFPRAVTRLAAAIDQVLRPGRVGALRAGRGGDRLCRARGSVGWSHQ